MRKEKRAKENAAIMLYLKGRMVWDSLGNSTALATTDASGRKFYSSFGTPAYGVNRKMRRFMLSNSKIAKKARAEQRAQAAAGVKQ